jgi:hypothetical protein
LIHGTQIRLVFYILPNISKYLPSQLGFLEISMGRKRFPNHGACEANMVDFLMNNPGHCKKCWQVTVAPSIKGSNRVLPEGFKGI